MQICKFILGQVACMKRGPHDDSVIYKDLEQIFISDQGTRCLFLEKKGGEGWRGGGGCYLVRALLFTERARAQLVCDTVLLLQECCVCWLTMSILAFDRAGIKVHTLHQGDSIVTVLIHPPLSLSHRRCAGWQNYCTLPEIFQILTCFGDDLFHKAKFLFFCSFFHNEILLEFISLFGLWPTG